MPSFSLSVGACGHSGRVREKNEDHYLLASLVEQEAHCGLVLPLASRSVQEHGFLCAVADGMGGYEGGAFASRVLLETLSAYFYSQPREIFTLAATRAIIEQALQLARSALAAQIRRDPQLSEAGSTLAGLVIMADGTAQHFHLGDSRILRWNAGFLRPLTMDHTPLAADILAGRLSEEEAAHSPLASHISRSFGADAAGDNTTSTLEWGDPFALTEGDLFLLVTDGCHGLGRGLSQSALNTILNSFTGDERALARHIVERAVESDGNDNTTALVLRVTSPLASISITPSSQQTISSGFFSDEDELGELDPFAH